MHLMLGWWNTALSPTKKKNRANNKELEAASTVVRFLLETVKVDFLALGEVSPEDIKALTEFLGETLQDFVVVPTQEKSGRSSFDTSLIYQKWLRVNTRESVIRRKLEQSTRVAQRFDLEVPTGEVLRTYVSHWPSRGTLGAWDPDRMTLGNALRGSVDVALEENPSAPLVLLGDFNDEPFDPVMDCALFSSRDKTLASKTQGLLYNPFWRHMSCYKHTTKEHQFSDKGTYFHAGGQITKWRTFDQMMFSSSLLNGKSGWLLDENFTRVVDVPNLVETLEDKSNIFDHMPIIGRIVKEGLA